MPWAPKYRAPIRNWYHSKFHDLRILASHEDESFSLIQKAVTDFGPDVIVEFGTGTGGLSLVLHECNRDTPLYSYDNKLMVKSPKRGKRKGKKMTPAMIAEVKEQAFNKNVHFIRANILTSPLQGITDMLESNQRVFLYSDNGDKAKEVRMYSPFLKKGDMLGVHDWGAGIDFTVSGIRKALSFFNQHPMNKTFVNLGLRTRLFIKK